MPVIVCRTVADGVRDLKQRTGVGWVGVYIVGRMEAFR